MSRLRSVILRALLLGAITAGGACSSSSNPFAYDRPPSRATIANVDRTHRAGTTVLVVGRLDDPARGSIPTRGVGRVLTESLNRTLADRADFDVWMDQQLSAKVHAIVENPRADRKRELALVLRDYPAVDYVVTGRVTDFVHTADLPDDVKRWGLFGRKREALVAIDFKVIDLHQQRVVAADHLTGTASAGKEPAAETYRNIDVGSYVFWSTPLGNAARKAIDKTAERIIAAVPPLTGPPTIVKLTGPRRAQLNAGRRAGLNPGAELYVCVPDAEGNLQVVRDPITDKPLTARVVHAKGDTATVLIHGSPPAVIDLRGAALTPEMPAPPPEPTAETVAAGPR